jgi:dTDP-4-amino-4,6-dideoxygalactose transaminase
MREIPYVNLSLQHQSIKDKILLAVDKVLTKGVFILGEEVFEFEKKFSSYCGAKYAIGVNSGTDALFLALKVLDIGPGDEVIVPPNSFLATASAVIAVGATPVFVDIREDLNIDPNLIEEKITSKTRAIIPVHLTGKPADMGPIFEIARRYNLKIIEDAAQSVGAEYHGKKVGVLGDIGCFSLHPLKTLNACGDAGLMTTEDEHIYKKLIQLRNIGLKNRDESEIWGFNSRLDTMQAAILNIKLDYLDSWNDRRRELASLYFDGLEGVVKTPAILPYEKQVFHTFVIQTPRRDQLQKFLEQNGVGTRIHYPIPIHLQAAAQRFGKPIGSFPVSEKTAKEILSLPVHQDLENEDVYYVIQMIKNFMDAN